MKKPMSAVEATLQKKRAGARPQFLASKAQRNPYSEGASMTEQDDEMPMEGETGFDDIREEIMALVREGRLPEDFDLQAACEDPAFAQLAAEFPMEAAIRVYAAEQRAMEAEANAMQRVTTQVKSRNALPRSTRGGAMSAPAVNYRDMDGETFRKLLADIKKTTRNGGRVRL